MDEQGKSPEEPLLWTLSEAARQLAVCSRTVSRLVDNGAFPVVRYGHRKYLPRQAVLDWVETQTRYNWGCVESVLSQSGDSLCDSINVTASTTLPTNQEVENKLDALLKPLKRE